VKAVHHGFWREVLVGQTVGLPLGTSACLWRSSQSQPSLGWSGEAAAPPGADSTGRSPFVTGERSGSHFQFTARTGATTSRSRINGGRRDRCA
jgi:hypothetical protein